MLEEVMDSFKNRYKENVTARRKLVGSGGIDLVETSTQKVGVAKPVIFGSATSMVTPAVTVLPKAPVTVAPAAVAKGITPVAKQ